MTDVWMTTLVSVGSAAFIGWVLYRIARVASPATPVEIGRTWLAYFLFLAALSNLPKFVRHLDVDSFLPFAVLVIAIGPLVFLAGWGYAKIKARQAQRGADKDLNERLYGVVWNEIRINRIDKVLWTRVFAECDGDHEKAKARYIQARVKQLREKKKATPEARPSKAPRLPAPAQSSSWVLPSIIVLGSVILLGALLLSSNPPQEYTGAAQATSARVQNLPFHECVRRAYASNPGIDLSIHTRTCRQTFGRGPTEDDYLHWERTAREDNPSAYMYTGSNKLRAYYIRTYGPIEPSARSTSGFR